MRGDKTRKRVWLASILLAGSIGYLLGGWRTVAIRSTGLSPAETVALRFPEDRNDSLPASPAAESPTTVSVTTMPASQVFGDPQLALLNPARMVPAPAARQQPAEQAVTVVPAPAQTAASPRTPVTAAAPPASRVKATPDRRPAERPGFVLNDAQIASIKQRLHLTPDQEPMWPAVEAALRNIAYATAREAHRRGTPANNAQLASADPDSVEVQGLKSAAIPLLMSFSPEQKNEVRNMAHVMGLDNLASQL